MKPKAISTKPGPYRDRAEPERVFVVAMNGVEPASLGDQAIFEYDDQIDVYIPGACPDDPAPSTTAAPTTAPATTAPESTVAPSPDGAELPETGAGNGVLAAVAVLLALCGAGLVILTRRSTRPTA